MEIKIGARIDNLRHKRNVSVEELSKTLHITERNVYKLFKKDDIWTSQLLALSEKLDYNFFELFKPATSDAPSKQKPTLESIENLKKTKINKEAQEVNFAVQYLPEASDRLGRFILNVQIMAEEMGLKVV